MNNFKIYSVLCFLSLGLIFGCESTDDDCTALAYKIPTTATTSKASSSKQILAGLDLSEDTSINMDLVLDGDLKLNGFTLTVNGSVTINDQKILEAGSGGKIFAEGDILITGDCKLEDAASEIRSYQGGITLEKDIVGPGTLTYCTTYNLAGIFRGSSPTVIQDCDTTLPVESLNFQQEEVSCDLIGTVKDGFRYLPIE